MAERCFFFLVSWLLLGNGSLDFNFLVEIKLGFPLNPQTVKLFAGGSTTTKV